MSKQTISDVMFKAIEKEAADRAEAKLIEPICRLLSFCPKNKQGLLMRRRVKTIEQAFIKMLLSSAIEEVCAESVGK